MVELVGEIATVLPKDFILLVASAFLISLWGLKRNEITIEHFLEKRLLYFVSLLGFFFLIIFCYNFWAFYNTPNIYCGSWEEGCTPLVVTNTDLVTTAAFISAVYIVVGSQFIEPANKLDKYRKNTKVKKWGRRFALAKLVLLFLIMAVVGASILFGGAYIFSQQQKTIAEFQPLVNNGLVQNDNNATLFFKNNSEKPKLITKIEIYSHLDLNKDSLPIIDWNVETCRALPKIIEPNKIDTVTCNGTIYKAGVITIDKITAYTDFSRYYDTMFDKIKK